MKEMKLVKHLLLLVLRNNHYKKSCGSAVYAAGPFCVIGNFNGISYYTKSPTGLDYTAAKRNYVAGVTCRRRRILQAGLFFCLKFHYILSMKSSLQTQSFLLYYLIQQLKRKLLLPSIYFSIQAFAVHSRAGVYQGISPACISIGSLYFLERNRI